MAIGCSICREVFVLQAAVVALKCGHVFHESCLMEWFNRTQSCPQCRSSAIQRPLKVFFTFENMSKMNPGNLENEIDKLEFDLRMKNAELARTRKREERLISVNCDLQKTVDNCQSEARARLDAIHALKANLRELQEENQRMTELQNDNESLKTQLKQMANVKKLIDNTQAEVHKMLRKTPVTPLAVNQLCVYVEALKQQLAITDENHKTEKMNLISEYKNLLKQFHAEGIELMNDENKLKKIKKLSTGRPFKDKLSKRRFEEESDPLHDTENLPHCSNTGHMDEVVPKFKSPPHLKWTSNIINILEKNKEKNNSGDLSDSDVEIIHVPKRSKIMRSSSACGSKSIFAKYTQPNESNESSSCSSADTCFEVWGGTRRNPLATPTPREELAFLSTSRSSHNKKPLKTKKEKALTSPHDTMHFLNLLSRRPPNL